ncbi:excisionase [Dyella kyungheensis]|uniref:excisionase n=1 Tax=Dyella kyungheensis TaxID=1242174 RepID=UPI003CF71B3D
MLRHVTISKFSKESGYTENAIRMKIKNGVWLEGVVWIKSPDGRVLIDTEGYEKWVAGQQVSALQQKAA